MYEHAFLQPKKAEAHSRASAYIKIAEGCDHPCSFCIIPRLRTGHHLLRRTPRLHRRPRDAPRRAGDRRHRVMADPQPSRSILLPQFEEPIGRDHFELGS
jgi:hypothetical protein